MTVRTGGLPAPALQSGLQNRHNFEGICRMPEYILGFAREGHPLLERLRRSFFRLHLLADFVAGVCFTVGSVFFFWPSLMTAGTWLFLIGSLLFVAKPTIRLVHELRRTRLVADLTEAGEVAGEDRSR
jgi:hypothetical protein